MLSDVFSNAAAYRVSLRGPGAELDGGVQTPPPVRTCPLTRTCRVNKMSMRKILAAGFSFRVEYQSGPEMAQKIVEGAD